MAKEISGHSAQAEKCYMAMATMAIYARCRRRRHGTYMAIVAMTMDGLGLNEPTPPGFNRHSRPRLTAKFHYASWFGAGSKLVAERFEAKFHYAIWFEAGRRPASNQLRTR